MHQTYGGWSLTVSLSVLVIFCTLLFDPKLDTLIDNLSNLLWGGAASISDGINFEGRVNKETTTTFVWRI